MKIPVDAFHALRRKCLAAVLRIVHLRAQLPDSKIICWVDPDLAVIGRSWICVAHLFPRLALVFAAVGAAFFMLHDGINDIWILPEDVQPDSPGIAAIFVRSE